MALLVRPTATPAALGVTAAVGALGLLAPLPAPRDPARPRLPTWAATLVGATVFAAGRMMIPPAAAPASAAAVLTLVVAAVAEEAFFRRLLYGWLLSWGAPAAVGLSALAFAVVHLPAYGVAALPVDLAAGLVFGWQRWACGRWQAAAFTHAAANLLHFW